MFIQSDVGRIWVVFILNKAAKKKYEQCFPQIIFISYVLISRKKIVYIIYA